MPKLTATVPVLRVADMEASRTFYVGRLGFRVDFSWGTPANYACLSRDDAACLHLSTLAGASPGLVCVFCEGVDALFDAIAAGAVDVVRPVGDEPYGMREFVIRDPDGHELVFGEAIMRAEWG